jgi:hypothetical protein
MPALRDKQKPQAIGQGHYVACGFGGAWGFWAVISPALIDSADTDVCSLQELYTHFKRM